MRLSEMDTETQNTSFDQMSSYGCYLLEIPTDGTEAVQRHISV